MKKIMILGAGIYQVPLIKTAKRLDITSVVVSIPGNYPGFELADKVYYEDTTDYETILEIAKKEQIDGIVTAGTDVAVITIGKVCDDLGLCGLTFDAAKIAANKILMKASYEEHGVRTARFRKIPLDETDVSRHLSSLSFPLIFKAVDTSGSRGIIRVDSEAEFDAAIQNVKENTKSDSYIVEEFIEGEEFGAQAFVYRGEVTFILPHGDEVFKGDTGVPVGHYAPYELEPGIIEDAREQLTAAINAMGLDNCAINADFILKDGKTYVLEIGGRSGATCLAELVSIYYGFDYYEKILRCALGEDVAFECGKAAVPNASRLLMSKDKSGVIKSQTDKNPENPDIFEVQFDYKPGDQVKKFHVGPDRIGHVITKGETLLQAQSALEAAYSNIEIQIVSE